jgi:hypothetical protein
MIYEIMVQDIPYLVQDLLFTCLKKGDIIQKGIPSKRQYFVQVCPILSIRKIRKEIIIF